MPYDQSRVQNNYCHLYTHLYSILSSFWQASHTLLHTRAKILLPLFCTLKKCISFGLINYWKGEREVLAKIKIMQGHGPVTLYMILLRLFYNNPTYQYLFSDCQANLNDGSFMINKKDKLKRTAECHFDPTGSWTGILWLYLLKKRWRITDIIVWYF